ncbi:fibroin heavy chain isoform X2 [Kryptolebias marmoratus]|uniref:fibroin heavy chain isoform X2 n=1 Tax=Kryptolebias marmoratus TaxID=37003 RepID=UPI0018ACCF50|nr:fibroin heavy chain isoform X2 [Kryptolebias marmoratus]
MLLRALLQTSLLLWFAQQTLQGGVAPQNVAYGRALPLRGVGVDVKPGVTGALGALGSRYNTKAMKTGIGRYPAAHLGVGGYRSLGLGSRGLRQGGYGSQGAYGASLGTGMGLRPGLTNGLGLGQTGKRVYGAGLGTLPGYGTFAGVGYPGVRPGVSAADLGGPEVSSLGQTLQDLKRKKSRAESESYGTHDRTVGPETPIQRRTSVLGPTVPQIHARIEVRNPNPVMQASSLRPIMPFDKRYKLPGAGVSQPHWGNEYEAFKRKGTTSHEATLAAAGVGRQLPVDEDIRRLDSPQVYGPRDSFIQEKQNAEDCESEVSEVNRFGLLGSETQRIQGLVPQLHAGKMGKYLGRTNPPSQERTYHPPSQGQDPRSKLFSTVQQQGTRDSLSALANRQDAEGLGAKDKIRPKIRDQHSDPLNPGASTTQSLGITLAEEQEGQDFIEGDAKDFPQAEPNTRKSKPLHIPGQAGGKTQAASYIGGAGNYLGASLGAGGYGAGLGQGAYLGGAAGKLGAAAALGQGYGDGATGYLGALAGNGFGGDPAAKALSEGYGNGYDGYGAALSTGGYAGPVQGAYGLDSTGGKYGAGVAQVPYGNAPVIPAGLEGTGGYPYATQQLSLGAEGAKTASKYGAAAGYGAQQAGFGAQLGATQDGLGEQAGKYDGVNAALGNGFKG